VRTSNLAFVPLIVNDFMHATPTERIIKIAENDKEIDSCYAVMSELRPHLSREEFLAQVKRQIVESGFPRSRRSRRDRVRRSKGYGGQLFD
jgi:hypothetical protein